MSEIRKGKHSFSAYRLNYHSAYLIVPKLMGWVCPCEEE